MLKITTTATPDGTTLRIEGRIVGGWVDELSRSVTETQTSTTRVVLDLSQVTFVDAIGVVFLRSAAANGVDFINPSDFVAGLIRGGRS